jgi:hypothetical protein
MSDPKRKSFPRSICPSCGGPADLLVGLDGPTGVARYQLVRCARCGTGEHMSKPQQPTRRGRPPGLAGMWGRFRGTLVR